MPKPIKYLNAPDVAQRTGRPYNEIINLVKTGVLPSHKTHRGHYRLNVDAVEAYFGIQINKPEEVKTPKEVKLDKTQKGVLSEVKSGGSLFVTGKAGTGKTLLLKHIKEDLEKRKKLAVVLAPTGIAAENAGGMTMHNFLRLPLKPYLPEHKTNPGLYQLTENVERIVTAMDVLIIDEISMVRCDMLDATDMILRHYRKNRKPFGGVQLVMFGDLYQLCPIAKSDEEVTLRNYYKSLYFFSCYAFKKLKYKVVRLQKIYRQDEPDFIKLLNHVREAETELRDLDMLQKRVEPDYVPDVKDKVVTLMTHNNQTDDWNERMFAQLDETPRTYDGIKTGSWYGERLPVKPHLKLKVNARVIFLRNDNEKRLYQNGTLGWVKKLRADSVVVTKDDGMDVEVERATWEQLDYYVDEKTKTILTYTVGKYKQIPLKLAWAVSIHKSQGLTFDEVLIDAAKSFAFGQVYVALSRCRTLKGIHLLSPIPYQKIIADPIVKQYESCIDKDGNVKLPKEFEPIKYEKTALELNVRSARFWKICYGEMKNYVHSIDNPQYAALFFKYERNKLCVQDAFKSIKKDWNYMDSYEGHCPFVQRVYRKVTFYCSIDDLYVDAEIDGTTEIFMNSQGSWSFRFRIGKVGKAH